VLDRVLPRLGALVLKPSYPAGAGRVPFDAITGGREARGRAVDPVDLALRVEADPDAFTAQAFLPFSQLPSWQQGMLVPRTAMLRVFAIADGAGNWHMMPGGLTRLGAGEQQRVSMQTGGSSADTWVLSDGPVDDFSMLPASFRAADVARQRPVTSRVAENLFWMGRYAERAEQGVRLARAALGILADDVLPPPGVLQVLAVLCERQCLVPDGVPSPAQSNTVFERTLVRALAGDGELKGIGFNLEALARAGGQIRDRLSAEHWRLITGAAKRFHADCAAAIAQGLLSADDAATALDRVAVSLAAITGAQADRMTRDDGWRLLAIGRQIERLVGLGSALHIVFGSREAAVPGGFDLLLALFDSSITYRALYQRRFARGPLLDLLVREPANPRSLGCVTAELRRQLMALAGRDQEGFAASLGTLLPDPEGWPAPLERDIGDEEDPLADLLALCEKLVDSAAALSDAIGARFFSHADAGFHAMAGWAGGPTS
jgi:uncharacterized alpha-E superfamily protein